MNVKMIHTRTVFSLFMLFLAFSAIAGTPKTVFDRSAFYSALAADDLESVNNQLAIVRSASINEKEAYEGALLMKKAGLVSKAKEKLSLFKAGRLKLEASIKKENGNAEFSFLRLIIQEHAPKAVNYR
ncbi:MAG TPA: hypothetical protein VHL77_05120, partial [Ferruginibacter sp.]|nr:hypothetical protein [Ferruginibacter sp.]